MPLFDPDWIRHADAGHFWIFTAAIGAVSLAGFFGIWRNYRRLLLVEDTPKSLIRSAAQGYVELEGEARLMPGAPIIAPLTRASCLWWSYRIEQYVRSGKSSHWKTIKSEISPGLFLIVDDTGQCVVDPDHALVYPSAKNVWYGNDSWPDAGPAMGAMRIGSSYRYTEERMHDQDWLYALGYFHTQDPVSDADIDEEVRQQLLAWKKDQAWLIQHFDTNHDGQVDMQEWDAARAEARRLVLEQERENMQRPPVNVLNRPPDGRDFILSTLPQPNLESRLRLYALGCLLLFFCAGALAAYLLSVRLS